MAIDQVMIVLLVLTVGWKEGRVVGEQFQSSWYFKYSTSLLRVKRKCLDLQQDPSTKIQIHQVF